MRKNNFYHLMLAASTVSTTAATPVECEMHKKFLQGERSKAE